MIDISKLCPLCQETMDETVINGPLQIIHPDQCKHKFHRTCLLEFCKEQSTGICPMEQCNKSISKINLHTEIAVAASEDCPICTQRLESKVAQPDSCDHQFCIKCLKKWSERTHTCPMDRLTFSFILILDRPASGDPAKDRGRRILQRMRAPKVCAPPENDVPPGGEDELRIDVVCQVCSEGNHEDVLILCDICDRAYHIFCLRVPLRAVPRGSWFCEHCRPRSSVPVRQTISTRRSVNPRRRPVPASLPSESSLSSDELSTSSTDTDDNTDENNDNEEEEEEEEEEEGTGEHSRFAEVRRPVRLASRRIQPITRIENSESDGEISHSESTIRRRRRTLTSSDRLSTTSYTVNKPKKRKKLKRGSNNKKSRRKSKRKKITFRSRPSKRVQLARSPERLDLLGERSLSIRFNSAHKEPTNSSPNAKCPTSSQPVPDCVPQSTSMSPSTKDHRSPTSSSQQNRNPQFNISFLEQISSSQRLTHRDSRLLTVDERGSLVPYDERSELEKRILSPANPKISIPNRSAIDDICKESSGRNDCSQNSSDSNEMCNCDCSPANRAEHKLCTTHSSAFLRNRLEYIFKKRHVFVSNELLASFIRDIVVHTGFTTRRNIQDYAKSYIRRNILPEKM